MLRMMRDKFKSLQWILWAVIASFVLWIFVAWGMGGAGDGSAVSGDSNLAMEIDGRAVTRTEFVRQLRDTEANYRAQFGEQAEQFLQQLNVREQVANALVSRQIALREARKAGLKVGDDELRRYILETFVDEKGEFLGVEKIERFARRQGYTDDGFKQALAEDLLQRKFQALVEGGVVISDAELKEEYLERNNKASAEFVFLDARALGQDATPAAADLETFYAANKDRFARDERKARYVMFLAADQRDRAEPSEAELRKEYDQAARFNQFDEKRHARHILIKTDAAAGDPAKLAELKARASALHEQAKAGGDFAKLAQENSEDQGSATKGGDLGSFSRGRMVKPFEEAVFTMTPGEIVGPVETQFGFHVIKLEAIEPGKTFEEARKDLEGRVRDQKASTLAREAAASALAAHLESGKIDELAKAASRPVQESGFLRQSGPAGEIPGVDAAFATGFAAALFRIEGEGKLAAEPVPGGSGFAIVQFAEKRGPVVPALAEIHGEVVEAWKLEQGKSIAATRASTIAAALAKGTGLAEAATAAGSELKTASPFGPAAALPGVPGSEKAAAAVWAGEVGKVSDAIELETGTVFVKTTEKFVFDPPKFEAEKEPLRSDLESSRQGALWSSLLGVVRKDLEASQKIRYVAQDLLRKPSETEGGEGDDIAF